MVIGTVISLIKECPSRYCTSDSEKLEVGERLILETQTGYFYYARDKSGLTWALMRSDFRILSPLELLADVLP